MNELLSNKRVRVTGATTGLGAVIARPVAEDARAIYSDRNAKTVSWPAEFKLDGDIAEM